MGTEVASDPGPVLNDAALNVLAWKQASLRGKVLPVKLQGPGVHGIENVVDISKESAVVCFKGRPTSAPSSDLWNQKLWGGA